VFPVTAYNDLSGYQFRAGKGYEKRSVEQFKAMALGSVDELLREVTQLQDKLAGIAQSAPPAATPESAMSYEEEQLLARFRAADGETRQAMLFGAAPAPVDVQTNGSFSHVPSPFENVPLQYAAPPIEPLSTPVAPPPPVPFGEPVAPVADSATPWTPADWSPVDWSPNQRELNNDAGLAGTADDEPEWLAALRNETAEPSATTPPSWFLDDAFGGAVPSDVRYPVAPEVSATETTWSDSPATASDWGTPASPDSHASEWDATPQDWLASPIAPTPVPPVSEPPIAEWEAQAASAWDAHVPTEWDTPASPPPWDYSGEPATVEADPLVPAEPATFQELVDIPVAPTDGSRQLDELFNQLDFGPPAADVLAVAGSMAPVVGSELAVSGPPAPLQVERPMDNPGPLPAPTPPWSGWIRPDAG
jgi:hypothetical protein